MLLDGGLECAALAAGGASDNWWAGAGLGTLELEAGRLDPDGSHTRRWVPELAGLAVPYVHRPWEGPPALLAGAGLRLGVDYPCRLCAGDPDPAASKAGCSEAASVRAAAGDPKTGSVSWSSSSLPSCREEQEASCDTGW